MTEVEINNWLLSETAYLSEGQFKRISSEGDLHSLIDLEDLNDYFDFSTREKIGVRMRGSNN